MVSFIPHPGLLPQLAPSGPPAATAIALAAISADFACYATSLFARLIPGNAALSRLLFDTGLAERAVRMLSGARGDGRQWERDRDAPQQNGPPLIIPDPQPARALVTSPALALPGATTLTPVTPQPALLTPPHGIYGQYAATAQLANERGSARLSLLQLVAMLVSDSTSAAALLNYGVLRPLAAILNTASKTVPQDSLSLPLYTLLLFTFLSFLTTQI